MIDPAYAHPTPPQLASFALLALNLLGLAYLSSPFWSLLGAAGSLLAVLCAPLARW